MGTGETNMSGYRVEIKHPADCLAHSRYSVGLYSFSYVVRVHPLIFQLSQWREENNKSGSGGGQDGIFLFSPREIQHQSNMFMLSLAPEKAPKSGRERRHWPSGTSWPISPALAWTTVTLGCFSNGTSQNR